MKWHLKMQNMLHLELPPGIDLLLIVRYKQNRLLFILKTFSKQVLDHWIIKSLIMFWSFASSPPPLSSLPKLYNIFTMHRSSNWYLTLTFLRFYWYVCTIYNERFFSSLWSLSLIFWCLHNLIMLSRYSSIILHLAWLIWSHW